MQSFKTTIGAWLMLATLGVGSGAGVLAQKIGSNTAPSQTETFKLTLNSQLVVEQVVVKDKKGGFVSGLTDKDFTVTEDGVPQSIKFCEHQQFSEAVEPLPPQPADDEVITVYKKLTRTQFAPEAPESNKYKDHRLLALYFDMTAMPPQDQMRALAAAENFIRKQMTAADLVSILRFNGGSVDVLQDFTADRNRLLSILETLIVGEGQGSADSSTTRAVPTQAQPSGKTTANSTSSIPTASFPHCRPWRRCWSR
jgi:VWFA-related protein